MKAWQFTGTRRPFERTEVPDPRPIPGRVIIDVKAVGLCHSDVGLLEDHQWLSIMKELPLVPGHETAGVITSVGEGVDGWKVGDRVGICPMAETHGYMIDGSWAEQMSASTEALVRIPDGVSFAHRPRPRPTPGPRSVP